MSEKKHTLCFDINCAEIKKIAEDCGCMKKVSEILSYKEEILSEKKVVAVAGGSNSGKSSLINMILTRDILHVSPASNPGRQISVEASREGERVICGGGKAISIDDYLSKRKQYLDGSNSFVFQIKDDWLEHSGIKLMEASNLEFVRENNTGLPHIIREADYVIYVISALMPLTKTDIESITLCVLNGIPCRILVSKLDLIETWEEQEEVLSYIKNQISGLFENVDVYPVNLSSGPEKDGQRIRNSIKEWINGVDIEESRDERLYMLMVEAINEINSYAEMMEKKAREGIEEKENSIKTKKDELELQRVLWRKLEQDMVGRRLNLRDLLEKNIRQNSGSISGSLIEEMNKAGNLKNWWENVMPGLMEEKVLHFSTGISREIDKKIEDDQKWLVGEVNRLFNLNIDIVRSQADIDGNISLQDSNVNLKKNRKWLVVSRVGMVVAVASALTLSPAGVCIGAAAGIAGFGMDRTERNQGMELIKSEILRYVNRYCSLYIDEMDKQLKQAYDVMIKELEDYSMKWQSEQLNMIQTQGTADNAEKPDFWDSIIKHCHDISAKIY